MLCEGTDFASSAPAMELDFNTDVARDLNAPVLLCVDGSSNQLETIYSKVRIGQDGFRAKGCEVIATGGEQGSTLLLPRRLAGLPRRAR